jgi:acetyl esterase/lipase
MTGKAGEAAMTTMTDEFAHLLACLPTFDLRDVGEFRAVVARARPPRPMTAHPDVTISHVMAAGDGPAPPVRVRVYVPSQRKGPSPGLVYCHGGGFVLGTLESDHERCLRFAAEGNVVVVSPNYRLAPEHRYPAGLDDCTTALEWLHAQADSLGVDRSRLAAGGTSAGGALSAGIALRARDRGIPTLSGLLLVCPVTDDRPSGGSIREFWECAGWNGSATKLMWGHYLPQDGAAAPYAAPNRAESLHGLPPTYLVIADLDPLRDEGLALAARLKEAGVATTLRHYRGVPHGFDALLPTAEVSVRSVREQVRWLGDLPDTVARFRAALRR